MEFSLMRFLITGAGPVGRALARDITARGHKCIIMTRKPITLEALGLDPATQLITADATHYESYPDNIDGIAHCIHAPYDAQLWRKLLIPAERTALAVAAKRDIPIVFPESVYAFDPYYEEVTPDTPLTHSPQGKPGVRAALLAARRASPACATSVVASDLIGPDPSPGCVYHQLIIGRRFPLALYNAHAKHSVTYLPDFARALADALLAPSSPPLITTPSAPALTQTEFAELAGCIHLPITIRPWMVRLGGYVDPNLKGLQEMRYLWTRPSILTGSIAEWDATPTDVALQEIAQAAQVSQ